jgi:hypothetical protein
VELAIDSVDRVDLPSSQRPEVSEHGKSFNAQGAVYMVELSDAFGVIIL